MNPPSLHAARFDQMTTRTFHDLVRLRIDTFVVEQGCAYAELDGRDVLDTTEHVWMESDGEPIAYLRTYPDADGVTWIGRVVTALPHRGRGLGAELMRHALHRVQAPVRIAAQARLEEWYARFGFVRCGPDYLEDGIAHAPMFFEGSRHSTGV